jgi:hypothetical protein
MPAVFTELRDQSRLGETLEFTERADTEPFQPLDDERVDRQGADRALREEPTEPRFRDDHRPAGSRGGRGDPGSELARCHPGTGCGDKWGGEDPEEETEGTIDLPGRRAEEAFKTVHAQKHAASAGWFDHWREFRECLEHRVDCGVIVGRIGLEECQGRAQRDGLGDQLSGADPGFMGAFGDLPDRAAGTFIRGEKGDRGTVQLRRANQFEPELEGREPEAEGLPAFCRCPGRGRPEDGTCPGAAGPAGVDRRRVQPVAVGTVVMSPPTTLAGGNRMRGSAGTSHGWTRHLCG